MRRQFIGGLMIFFWMTTTAAEAPKTQSPVLSDEARRLLERGVVAADAKEWAVASQYFGEAQKFEPLHPKVLFNLGFAYLNAGRPVLADLWWRAYLAVAPEAPNAPQVKAEISRLDIKIQSASAKLIGEAMTGLQELPDSMSAEEREAFQAPVDPSALQGQKAPPDLAQRRKNTVGAILFAQTATGRITEAANFAARMSLNQVSLDSLHRYFGQVQADAGDFEGAERTLGEIQMPAERDALLNSLAVAEIAAEALASAERHLDLVSDIQQKIALLDFLIFKRVRQLEPEAAEAAFSRYELPEADRVRLTHLIMTGYLKKDLPEEARRLAEKNLAGTDAADPKKFGITALALAGMGRFAESLELLRKADAQLKKEALQILHAAALLAQCQIWSGQDLDALQPVLDFIRRHKAPVVFAMEHRILAAYYAERGDIDRAAAEVRQMPVNEKDSLPVSLFWRLVQKKLYGKAAKMALVSESALVRSRLFLKLADAVQGPEAAFQKRELRERSLKWALEALDPVGLRELARGAARDRDSEFAARAAKAAAAVNWIELADYFTRVPSTSDLNQHLESLKLQGFDAVPYGTAMAALDWGRVSVYIKARERKQIQG
ncbi:MAG: hypothetical protein HY714_06200 [Candidatus Omnitrophica bacterium]|nr:hypothetical protein [Candidatus Omnitrophota bacterium]